MSALRAMAHGDDLYIADGAAPGFVCGHCREYIIAQISTRTTLPSQNAA
jgi:hypothetical protein